MSAPDTAATPLGSAAPRCAMRVTLRPVVLRKMWFFRTLIIPSMIRSTLSTAASTAAMALNISISWCPLRHDPLQSSSRRADHDPSGRATARRLHDERDHQYSAVAPTFVAADDDDTSFCTRSADF